MKRLVYLSLLIGCVALFGSCKIFQKSVDLDMQPFSDNTTVLFQEAAKVDRPFQFKSLSIYKDIEKYGLLKEKAEPIIRGLRGITYYSNQLVAISNAKMSEKSKNEQLSIYVQQVFDRLERRHNVDSLGLSNAQIDSTLIQIKRAPTFREGVEAADPIVKTLILTMNERLDEIERLMEEVVIAFEGRIYDDYELAIENYLTLKLLENNAQYRLTNLYKAYSGEPNTLDSLLSVDKALSKFITSSESITKEEFEETQEFLLGRLGNLDSMLRQLDDDKQDFMNLKSEISTWHLQADEKIKITRNSLIVWSQAHKNLGQGIVTPPLLGLETIFNLVAPAIKSAF